MVNELRKLISFRNNEKEWTPIQYDNYIMSRDETVQSLLMGMAFLTFFSWIFYRSIIFTIILQPFSVIYIKMRKIKLLNKRKWELTLQFREGVNALVASLGAGYSVENAFIQAIQDLRLMYGEEAMIIQEFEYIVYQISINITVEEAMNQFAARSDIEDIKSLAEVFITAKRSGGDFIKILRSSSKIIGDKIEVYREIQTLMTAKKYEANIMSFIPVGIILYMWVFSPGFLDPLYHNIVGIFIMTLALGIYMIAYRLMVKIVTIKV
ncbi:MAG TPA: type II secretion system F family protein [Lachnospiraceae bacterium]|nr:type II secretion system F family protein [Lachnospiraceae bacterium]